MPARGQAATVQGELIRAVEKLRDEAHRNGNVNWSDDHAILVNYVRNTLLTSGMFDLAAKDEIERDSDRVLDFEHPETSDEPYDRPNDRVVDGRARIPTQWHESRTRSCESRIEWTVAFAAPCLC